MDSPLYGTRPESTSNERGYLLVMVGPPGSGKSMLAARLPSILPPLSPAELLEVSMIASVAGALTNKRPFRSPHHSASMPALVGGGLRARPGEISLAHNGVLFLDEMPEFTAQVLDSLRQPLESGEVAIARVNHRITYPARFMLVAAMNPCRCGRASDPGFACKRGPNVRCAADYQGRLSGPLLDRIDLHIEVPAVTAADLILPPPSEGSREVAARVARARDIQAERYAALGAPQVRCNAQASGPMLEDVARADSAGMTLLREAADRMHPVGARLSSCIAGRAHARRSRRRGPSRPRASGRGLVVPRARRRSAKGRVTLAT
jgi:magnesium chelatase family protein